MRFSKRFSHFFYPLNNIQLLLSKVDTEVYYDDVLLKNIKHGQNKKSLWLLNIIKSFCFSLIVYSSLIHLEIFENVEEFFFEFSKMIEEKDKSRSYSFHWSNSNFSSINTTCSRCDQYNLYNVSQKSKVNLGFYSLKQKDDWK